MVKLFSWREALALACSLLGRLYLCTKCCCWPFSLGDSTVWCWAPRSPLVPAVARMRAWCSQARARGEGLGTGVPSAPLSLPLVETRVMGSQALTALWSLGTITRGFGKALVSPYRWLEEVTSERGADTAGTAAAQPWANNSISFPGSRASSCLQRSSCLFGCLRKAETTDSADY